MDSSIISFNLDCITQLKQFYNIATKVSSRKKCYYFWWSTWLVRRLWSISLYKSYESTTAYKITTAKHRTTKPCTHFIKHNSKEPCTVFSFDIRLLRYSDVIMGTMVSQITSPTDVYATVCSGVEQRKHQSSASLVFVRGIHRWPLDSPHKGPVTSKMFPDDGFITQN